MTGAGNTGGHGNAARPSPYADPAHQAAHQFLADMGHFDQDMYALRKRVQRPATDHAWTEDPPSRTRHFVITVPSSGRRILLCPLELEAELPPAAIQG